MEILGHLLRNLKPSIDGLGRLTDHLRGRNRINFKRLFHATSFGKGCWELDRAGVKMPRFLWELTEKKDGYFLPGWTWDEVREALYRNHLVRVAEKEESVVPTTFKPAKEDRL